MTAQDALVQIAVTVGAAHMLRVVLILLRLGAQAFVAAVTVGLAVRLQFADLVLGTLVRSAWVWNGETGIRAFNLEILSFLRV